MDVTTCEAVLIDGDNAIEYLKPQDEAPPRTVSFVPLILRILSFILTQGTTGFISVRLLNAWGSAHTAKKHILPTHIDDLESCLWVIVYTALEIGEHLEKQSYRKGSDIRTWVDIMNTSAQVVHPKELLVIQIQKLNTDVPWVVRPLQVLLSDLFNIITHAHKERNVIQNQGTPQLTIPKLYEALDPLVEDTFEKVFATILKHLDTLPDTWHMPP